MRAWERLVDYAKVWTTSDGEGAEKSPSAEREFDLARKLVEEMKALGIEDAQVDGNCYVTGTIPATEGCEKAPALGFIAHMDTSPDASGKDVKPQIHENYDGGKLEIGSGLTLDPETFPHLRRLAGSTLITSDGTTLLGADDKAGVAEIMTLAEILIHGRSERNLPAAVTDGEGSKAVACNGTAAAAGAFAGKAHGKICIAFTPDEEIGGGAELLDLEKFGADYGYTVDGGEENEITYETFNAAGAVFTVKGVSVHTGSAKGIMVNAGLVAQEIGQMLPAADIPALTEGYEGFFHLCSIEGNVTSAQAVYLIRDHDAGAFAARKALLEHIAKTLNEKYGAGTVTLEIRDQYRNMEEKIRPCMHLVDTAKNVMESLGLQPDSAPVRGGTDGAQLSYRGLPCPNLGTGGYAFHGPMEHITVEGMDRATAVLLGIVDAYAARD